MSVAHPGLRPAVAYRRVSSPQQARSGHSLDEDQPAIIERIARTNGLRIVAEFTDVASGGSHARRGLLDLLDHLVDQRIDAVAVAFTDRITRSQSAAERGALQDALARQKVTIFASDGTYDLSQSSNVLTWDVTTAVSAHRLREISSRLRASQRRSAEAGIWRSSWCPIGFQRVFRSRDEHERTGITCDLVPDPVMGPVVHQLFEDFAAGVCIAELGQQFNEAGHRTNRGKPIMHAAIRWMLNNAIYAGLLVRERDGEAIVREAVNVEPLVPMTLWHAVQAQLQVHKQVRPRSRDTGCLLAGLLTCGACGARVWRHSGNAGTARSPIYYRCSNAIWNSGCHQPAVREMVLVEALLPYVRDRLSPDAAAARAAEATEAANALRQRIAVLDKQLDWLTSQVLLHIEDPTRGIPQDEYDTRTLGMREELTTLRTELAAQSPPEPLLADHERDIILERLTRDQLRRVLQQTLREVKVQDRHPLLPPKLR